MDGVSGQTETQHPHSTPAPFLLRVRGSLVCFCPDHLCKRRAEASARPRRACQKLFAALGHLQVFKSILFSRAHARVSVSPRSFSRPTCVCAEYTRHVSNPGTMYKESCVLGHLTYSSDLCIKCQIILFGTVFDCVRDTAYRFEHTARVCE